MILTASSCSWQCGCSQITIKRQADVSPDGYVVGNGSSRFLDPKMAAYRTNVFLITVLSSRVASVFQVNIEFPLLQMSVSVTSRFTAFRRSHPLTEDFMASSRLSGGVFFQSEQDDPVSEQPYRIGGGKTPKKKWKKKKNA